MNVLGLAGVLRARAALRSHDRWTRDQLLAHQQRALRDLRDFALARSPLYADLHSGLEDAPLTSLPVITKATVMDRFDDLVTDRDVRLHDVQGYLETAGATSRFRDRYRVSATGGTTGRRGIFLSDPGEWRTVLASYARAYDWAGIATDLTHRLRMAVVSSIDPAHQSAIVGATVASRFIPTLRLDATHPIGDLVGELNAFGPDVLVGYASMLRSLADEQLAGRLRIRPRGVLSASEILTDATRERSRLAFGVAPTNVYAATETAGIASECRHGRMHRYEDLVITEIVDEDDQPLADGEPGAKLLVTVLFSRTLPLIRYELSDRVAAAPGVCPDGLPFALLADIQGREEEVLTFHGVDVHPNVFHAALEPLPVGAWQVIDDGWRLRVLVAGAKDGLEPPLVERAVKAALQVVGVGGVVVEAELVESIPKTKLGKTPLILRAARPLGSSTERPWTGTATPRH